MGARTGRGRGCGMTPPTQNARILTLLTQRGERGITAMDMLSPTADGGPPVMRLPSRIDELRRCGYRISSRMVATAGGARVARYILTVASGSSAQSYPDEAPAPAAFSDAIGGHGDAIHEPLALDIGGTVEHRPASPYDLDVEGC